MRTKSLAGMQNHRGASTNLGQETWEFGICKTQTNSPHYPVVITVDEHYRSWSWWGQCGWLCEGMQSIGLVESRSNTQLDVTPLIDTRNSVGKHTDIISCSSCSDLIDEPRDNGDKWQRRCLINAKGLVFEDSTTPGKASRRELCL